MHQILNTQAETVTDREGYHFMRILTKPPYIQENIAWFFWNGHLASESILVLLVVSRLTSNQAK